MRKSMTLASSIIALGLLAACTGQSTNNNGSSSSAASSLSSVRSSESSSSSVAPSGTNTKVLVSQSFGAAAAATGYERLVAMGVTRLKGNVSSATLKVESDIKTAIMVYFAPANEDGTINQALEYKRFAVLNGTFTGGTGCPNRTNDFTAGGTFNLDSVPVSSTDRCSTDSVFLDIQRMANGDGAYIGFFPVNSGATITASIDYNGQLDVSPLVSR